MGLLPVKTPTYIKRAFPRLMWDYSTEERALYLTFDDGPTPGVTDWTLDLLDQYEAKGTFFCIGKNIELHPDLYRRILVEGHGVGNHTYNHLNGWKTKTGEYLANIEQARRVMQAAIPESLGETVESGLFRPPYGKIRPIQADLLMQAGYQIVMWSVVAKDWDQSLPRAKCLDHVIKNAKSGDIVVLHDSVKASEQLKFVLPAVLDYFSERGYVFKRIPGSVR